MNTIAALKTRDAMCRCALRCLFDVSENRCAGKTARTASPSQSRTRCASRSSNNNIAGASRKAEDEFRPFAHAALSLAIGQVARTRVRMQRIPAATPGRKRASTPGRDRIRLRSQQAKPLPVDLNPYLRRWADLITCACATFYQAAPPACGFVSQLQVPGPSTL